jgi:drug/metabolite transporter (DMT)-like permease
MRLLTADFATPSVRAAVEKTAALNDCRKHRNCSESLNHNPVLSKLGLNRGWLSPRAEVRTFWSLLTGSVIVGLLGLILEMPQQLVTMTLVDASVLIYLGVFSSGMTLWLTQRATAVLSPAAVTAYSYLVSFASMLLLLIGQPHRMGWHWLPGSLLVVLAIAPLLMRRPVAQVAKY